MPTLSAGTHELSITWYNPGAQDFDLTVNAQVYGVISTTRGSIPAGGTIVSKHSFVFAEGGTFMVNVGAFSGSQLLLSQRLEDIIIASVPAPPIPAVETSGWAPQPGAWTPIFEPAAEVYAAATVAQAQVQAAAILNPDAPVVMTPQQAAAIIAALPQGLPPDDLARIEAQIMSTVVY